MVIKKYEESNHNRDFISLFSGAMGLDLGLIASGLSAKICQDFDKNCIATIRANGHNVMSGDIRNIQAQDLLDITGLTRGEPFLICGGPPCQPFSTAGKRLGINDPRGSLFMDFVRIIKDIRPRFFIMENVKGLISARIKNSFLSAQENEIIADEARGSVLDLVLSEFKSLGYKTVYGVLDSVNYGAPQFRERFVIIGSRDNEDIFLPMPTHFQMHQNSQYLWRTLRSAIADLEFQNGECASFSEERTNLLKLVPEGGNWKNLPKNLVKAAMGGAYESGGGKVGFYRRLSYEQPSPTVVTSPVQKASMLCHPTQDRPLSIREFARIQQFPDDWIFTGTVSAKYRQIGNAVPVGLAKALGQAIISVADANSQIKTKRMRGTNIHSQIQNALQNRG